MTITSNKQHDSWHWGSIVIHWLSVLVVMSLFVLGLWMVELNYYSDWYRSAPNLHKSFGVLLFILTLVRIVWLKLKHTPSTVNQPKTREQKLARIAHKTLYFLLFSVMIFGYLISTADGRAIEIFNVVPIPAIIFGFDKQEDIAGIIHLWLAIILISLVTIHAAAALKHHFINKDQTLKRMLGL
ncbi:Cytochrome B561 [hydrothermal vent metagenome]|uniref:Cytochrome B561 n=1 Tax=hydrothermal vent metagenome TaxID=652676 RepID=A0A3B1A896_9ZZZZ